MQQRIAAGGNAREIDHRHGVEIQMRRAITIDLERETFGPLVFREQVVVDLDEAPRAACTREPQIAVRIRGYPQRAQQRRDLVVAAARRAQTRVVADVAFRNKAFRCIPVEVGPTVQSIEQRVDQLDAGFLAAFAVVRNEDAEIQRWTQQQHRVERERVAGVTDQRLTMAVLFVHSVQHAIQAWIVRDTRTQTIARAPPPSAPTSRRARAVRSSAGPCRAPCC